MNSLLVWLSCLRSPRWRSSACALAACGCWCLLCVETVGQTTSESKRQQLPNRDALPQDLFFRNAFEDALVGARPERLRAVARQPTVEQPRPPRRSDQGATWTDYVSARTLEDEVKLLQIAVQKAVTTPARFRSGDYRAVRRMYTELAVLFAVISQFEGDVRWKAEAPRARDLFARAAANAKVSSLAAFNEANLRKQDIEELVRGGSLTGPQPSDRVNHWERICDRAPLMEGFTQSFEEGILVWISSEKSFATHLESTVREAELLRLMSVVLTKEGMEDAHDDDYVAYCRELRRAADNLIQAVRSQNRTDARQAASDMRKSCDRCHDDYRG